MAENKSEVKDKEPQQRDAFCPKTFIREEVAKVGKAVFNQIAQQISNKATQLDQLADAYIKAVAASRDPHKNATNPHLRNQYADLGSVLSSVRESFLSNGLWLMQFPGTIEAKSDGNPYISMNGLLIHASGQSIQLSMQLPAFTVSKDGKLVLNPQTSGSALSYARRYMWLAVGGITQTDDDAAEASYVPVKLEESAGISQGSAPQDVGAQMVAAIQATKSMEELKALREAANGLKNQMVQKVYLAQRETFLAGQE